MLAFDGDGKVVMIPFIGMGHLRNRSIPNMCPVAGNPLDEAELTGLTLKARRQVFACYDWLRTRMPGLEKVTIEQTGMALGVRESRRVRGRKTLTRETVLGAAKQPYVVTIYNERNASVRSLARGARGRAIAQGSVAVTGFGHFAERAEYAGMPWYNTSVHGKGDRYPNPKSAVLRSEDSFLLLTFRKGKDLVCELTSTAGQTIDRRTVPPRKAKPSPSDPPR